MTHPVIAFCLVLIVAVLGSLGTVALYNSVRDGGMADAMWDQMRDMGGMMDGGAGMHGMMGRGGGPQTTGSATGEGAVSIVDFSFQPTTLNVTPGTVVTWTNEDSAPHTATGDDFDTGMLNRGDSNSVTFDTPGTYDYICTYHPSMAGSVVVSPQSQAGLGDSLAAGHRLARRNHSAAVQ